MFIESAESFVLIFTLSHLTMQADGLLSSIMKEDAITSFIDSCLSIKFNSSQEQLLYAVEQHCVLLYYLQL